MPNQTFKLGLIALLLIFASFAPIVHAGDDDDVTFILRVGPLSLPGVLNTFGLEVDDAFPSQNLYRVERESGNTSEPIEEFIDRVRADPRVLGFELNEDVETPELRPRAPIFAGPLQAWLALRNRTFVNLMGTPAWTGYLAQPAALLVKTMDTHRTLATGSGMVAVIDTGVDPHHPLLRGFLTPGYDFTTNTPDASEWKDIDPDTQATLSQQAVAFLDQAQPLVLNNHTTAILSQQVVAFLDTSKLPTAFGHGTMVAGVIRLAAPTARIMPLKAFRSDGTSNTYDIIRAIYVAASNGARVINMSFNMPASSAELQRAIDFASARNAVCVASVGNNGESAMVFPAGYPNVIGVASTTIQDQRSSFSNFGEVVTLAAPGEAVVTTFPGGGYANAWGTSFATPLVAGTAALLNQVRTGITQETADQCLRQAQPLTPDLGAGRLQVLEAVRFCAALP